MSTYTDAPRNTPPTIPKVSIASGPTVRVLANEFAPRGVGCWIEDASLQVSLGVMTSDEARAVADAFRAAADAADELADAKGNES